MNKYAFTALMVLTFPAGPFLYLLFGKDGEKKKNILRTVGVLFLIICVSIVYEAATSPTSSSNINRAAVEGESQVAVDDKSSIAQLQSAAEQGNNQAQFNLGVAYYNGQGVEKDYTAAVKWWQKAAEQGNDQAQFNLGVAYLKGIGVEKDYTAAVKWYQKAADQGNAKAQYLLGNAYHEGWGIEKDDNQAVVWWHKAADQGNAMAKTALTEADESNIPTCDSKQATDALKDTYKDNNANLLDWSELSEVSFDEKEGVRVCQGSVVLNTGDTHISYTFSRPKNNSSGFIVQIVDEDQRAAEQNRALEEQKAESELRNDIEQEKIKELMRRAQHSN